MENESNQAVADTEHAHTATGSSTSSSTGTEQHERAETVEELLIEEISIDGMCGVY